VNVDKLCRRNPRLNRVRALAERYKFFHWELEYADLFARRGGFDLVLGNPPWVKVEWDEGGLLSEYEPRFAVRGFSKTQIGREREAVIETHGLRDAYLADYERAEGTQAFLNARQNGRRYIEFVVVDFPTQGIKLRHMRNPFRHMSIARSKSLPCLTKAKVARHGHLCDGHDASRSRAPEQSSLSR
jgi:hypothetical protein